jgi:hypothetical protein
MEGQLRHSGPESYTTELRKVWKNVKEKCRPDARLVVRFGCLNSQQIDALGVLRESFAGTGWAISTVKPAGSAAKGKRQSLHFLRETEEAFHEYDVWACLKN